MVKEVLAAAAIVIGMALQGDGEIMVIGVEALEEALEEEQVLEEVHLEDHLIDLIGSQLHCPL